ncbi:MAG: hypothetical protein M3122_01065 [Actinomycetota bacterium]|nr:hypothetical protein [Actinomycetota bacterium]
MALFVSQEEEQEQEDGGGTGADHADSETGVPRVWRGSGSPLSPYLSQPLLEHILNVPLSRPKVREAVLELSCPVMSPVAYPLRRNS